MRLDWLFAFAALAVLAPTAAHADEFRWQDVSPNQAFATPVVGNLQAAGPALGLATDDTEPDTVYAAAWGSGVWKSTDRARTWQHASTGLTVGWTIANWSQAPWNGPGEALAARDRQILYATRGNADIRTNSPGGGLWVSTNGAAEWRHVDLPGCPRPTIESVAFTTDNGWVNTSCGLYVSAGRDLDRWTPVSVPGDLQSLIAARGHSLFTCRGTSLRRLEESSGGSPTRWSDPIELEGACLALAAVPSDAPRSDDALVMSQRSNGNIEVTQWRIGEGLVARLGGPNVPPVGSGRPGLYAGRIAGSADTLSAGSSFDVYVASALQFYHRQPSRWVQTPGPHSDTQSMAFAADHQPGVKCGVYNGTDGGIAVPSSCPAVASDQEEPAWVTASSGFRGMGVRMTGGPFCPNSPTDCRLILAVGTPHVDSWLFVEPSDRRGTDWRGFNALGDAGQPVLDPGDPRHLIAQRNGNYRQYSGDPVATFADPSRNLQFVLRDGSDAYGSIDQIRTPPGRPRPPQGDYIAFRITDDVVVRNRSGSRRGWAALNVDGMFRQPLQQVAAGTAADGTVVAWARTVKGALFRARLDGLRVVRWMPASPPGMNARNMFVNPYDPETVYVSDAGTGRIRVRNAAGSWADLPELTGWALEDERSGSPFAFACSERRNDAFVLTCPLAGMAFLPNGDRGAVLFPSGELALSRDGGRTWLQIRDLAGGRRIRDFLGFPQDLVMFNRQVRVGRELRMLTEMFVGIFGYGIIRVTVPSQFDVIRITTHPCLWRRIECDVRLPPPRDFATQIFDVAIRAPGGARIAQVARQPDGRYVALLPRFADTKMVGDFVLEADGRVVGKGSFPPAARKQGSTADLKVDYEPLPAPSAVLEVAGKVLVGECSTGVEIKGKASAPEPITTLNLQVRYFIQSGSELVSPGEGRAQNIPIGEWKDGAFTAVLHPATEELEGALTKGRGKAFIRLMVNDVAAQPGLALPVFACGMDGL